jgi:capsid protein
MLQSKFVPASEIDHIYDPLRPGQARGVSMFAPVALLLRDIGDWKDAELMRKKIAACFAAFVTKPAGPGVSPIAPAAGKDPKGNLIERFSPGMVGYLQPGEEVEFGSPAQDSGEVEYLVSQLHTVCNAVGLPFSMGTGILNEANFAGMRVGVIDFMDLLDHMQWHVMVPRGLRRMWKRVGQVAVATGERKADDPGRTAGSCRRAGCWTRRRKSPRTRMRCDRCRRRPSMSWA